MTNPIDYNFYLNNFTVPECLSEVEEYWKKRDAEWAASEEGKQHALKKKQEMERRLEERKSTTLSEGEVFLYMFQGIGEFRPSITTYIVRKTFKPFILLDDFLKTHNEEEHSFTMWLVDNKYLEQQKHHWERCSDYGWSELGCLDKRETND